MAGRPAKSINVSTGSRTKKEIEERKKIEESLRGATNNIKPFDYLSNNQKVIFNYLITEMEASGILGNLDVYLLNNAAIAIDRLKTLEAQANKDPTVILDDKFLKARKEYNATFNKCCDSLCLSPTARAKMGSIKVQKSNEDTDPLLKALKKIKGGE